MCTCVRVWVCMCVCKRGREQRNRVQAQLALSRVWTNSSALRFFLSITPNPPPTPTTPHPIPRQHAGQSACNYFILRHEAVLHHLLASMHTYTREEQRAVLKTVEVAVCRLNFVPSDDLQLLA